MMKGKMPNAGNKLVIETAPWTNGDAIRSMKDEELAEFLAEYRCVHKAPHCMETNCVQCWLKWLKQEATP